MDFTSGGTDGPRFAADANGLASGRDLSTNVWGSFPSARSAQQVAEAFHTAGWRVRKSSWTEFEVENIHAELELRPTTPVHFSGIVVPERVNDLLAVFTTLGLEYSVELSDWRGNDLAVYRSGDTGAHPS